MLPELNLAPGDGPHWERLAEWIGTQLPPDQIDGVWVFRVVRRDMKEYGTAVLSRVEGDRRRIYTARYVATIKGKQRGGFESDLSEVGSGPLEALHELLALVPVRADDEDPPAPVEVSRWFPPVVELPPEAEMVWEASADVGATDDGTEPAVPDSDA